MTNQYIKHYQNELERLEHQSMRRTLKVTESACAPIMLINGRETLTFCSNDYLGLANHPDILKALAEGVRTYGGGSGASHLISGHSISHQRIDTALAKTQARHISDVHALTLSTGYMANMAILSALVLGFDESESISIFSEELNHASLIDSIRLVRNQKNVSVHLFDHLNTDQLEELLKRDVSDKKIIVSDAVFSMDGDIANIPKLLELAERFDALCVIDDAHGFGVLGHNGHGTLEHFNLSQNSRTIYMGTLGKAAGLSGAFIAAHQSIIEWILQKGRAYIYTTASPPLIAHGLLTSIQLIESGITQKKLFENIRYFKEQLKLQRWQLLESITAIQPIVIGDNKITMKTAQRLFEEGIWVPGIRPPTVPENTARLRVTLSAAHSKEQIDQLIQKIHDAEARL